MQAVRPADRRKRAEPAPRRNHPTYGASRRRMAIGAAAVGALAIGALAIGAVAIGRLTIGGLRLRRGSVHRLRIEELEIGRLTVRETRAVAGGNPRPDERCGNEAGSTPLPPHAAPPSVGAMDRPRSAMGPSWR